MPKWIDDLGFSGIILDESRLYILIKNKFLWVINAGCLFLEI